MAASISSIAGACHRAVVAPVRVAPVRAPAQTAHSRANVVVQAKGKSRMRQGSGQQQREKPPTPPVDPDNEEFVVFVRAVKMPRWIPFTIVKGGPQANTLVKAMGGAVTEGFYSQTLINNIGEAVYKNGDEIIQQVRTGIPGYKNFQDFEFGFKIRDRTKPDDWYLSANVVELPKQEALPKGPLDSMKSSFGALFKTMKNNNKGAEEWTP